MKWLLPAPRLAFLVVALASCAPSPRVFVGGQVSVPFRIGVLPLVNYTQTSEAPDRLGSILSVELARKEGFLVIDPGRVEEVLAYEPWMLADRIPPDLVDSLGVRLGADALLLGSVLTYGYRLDGGEQIPETSLALRILKCPGGQVLWSAVHSRDGSDRETVFGFGKTSTLERLALESIQEMLKTMPRGSRLGRDSGHELSRKGN
jgi:hypothetical protein